MKTTDGERRVLRKLAEEGLEEDQDSEAMTATWQLIIDTIDDLEQAILYLAVTVGAVEGIL